MKDAPVSVVEIKDWDRKDLKHAVARFFEEDLPPGGQADAFDIFVRFGAEINLASDVLEELASEGKIYEVEDE